jgi:RNA polymerase sigma factor for flagellar operon FliA
MSTLHATDEDLILRYQGFVRSVATTAWKTVLGNVDLEDLVSYGQLGLVQAARSYDPQSGAEFSTYAYYRVRGAIFDGYSSMQWMSRAQYRRICEQLLTDEVLQEHERDAAGASSADDAQWCAGAVGKLVVVHLALEAGERGPQAGLLEDKSAERPGEALELSEACDFVRRAVAELPDDERTLVESVYLGGQTLTAAAKLLGKSKSWASRLHDRALERLMRKLQGAGMEQPTS